MKTIRFILMSLVLGIGLGSISRPTLAQKEVKLIGVEDGLDNEQLCADIVGDSVVVGAHKVGIAKIYVGDGKKWKEQAELTAGPDAAHFGWAVSLAGRPDRASANTAIVGAPSDNHAGAKKNAGSAYIFVRSGDTWKQQVKLIPKAERKGDQFGSGVAVAGNIAIVGAAGVDEAGVGSGAAYGFARVDGVWEEKKKVRPDDEGPRMKFGAWVAISGDMVVVSAHNTPSDAAWLNRGNGTAAYVYNSVEDFGTPPFLAVEPFGLRVTTLGRVKRTALLQNFPNPFNPETWLPYRLAADAPVTLGIYNVRGQLMRELNLGVQKAGGYLTRETAAYWDGRDQVGETVSSGIYFYTLHAAPFQATRRMLILK